MYDPREALQDATSGSGFGNPRRLYAGGALRLTPRLVAAALPTFLETMTRTLTLKVATFRALRAGLGEVRMRSAQWQRFRQAPRSVGVGAARVKRFLHSHVRALPSRGARGAVRRAPPAALVLPCLSAIEPLHRNPVPRGVRAPAKTAFWRIKRCELPRTSQAVAGELTNASSGGAALL